MSCGAHDIVYFESNSLKHKCDDVDQKALITDSRFKTYSSCMKQKKMGEKNPWLTLTSQS